LRDRSTKSPHLLSHGQLTFACTLSAASIACPPCVLSNVPARNLEIISSAARPRTRASELPESQTSHPIGFCFCQSVPVIIPHPAPIPTSTPGVTSTSPVISFFHPRTRAPVTIAAAALKCAPHS